MGKASEAANLCDEAIEIGRLSHDLWYRAEALHLRGEIALLDAKQTNIDPEVYFKQALETAQGQSAKSWELRAATSLARLWQSQGKAAEAHDLLAPVYDWFTEGFDTPDLIDAKALLHELASG
ncbi:MAG: hypothetical protein QGF53_13610 [Alphaproteobacteria bacterium]|nr:hypothetical protein [Alphaproteobacteria bacterium]